MLALTGATRIYLYRGAADMRKSFDGLCGIVRGELGGSPAHRRGRGPRRLFATFADRFSVRPTGRRGRRSA